MNKLTLGNIRLLDFEKQNGLIPVIVQNIKNGEVLMLAFANQEALEISFDTGKMTFFSRSQNKIWTKGETSGNYLLIHQLNFDCDQDTILALVTPTGNVCHTGTRTCFGSDYQNFSFLNHLQEVIKDRRNEPTSSSYTSSLFDAGLDRIAQKVGEEGVETVIAALSQTNEDLMNESADLIYHLMVLWIQKGLSLELIIKKLKERHN